MPKAKERDAVAPAPDEGAVDVPEEEVIEAVDAEAVEVDEHGEPLPTSTEVATLAEAEAVIAAEREQFHPPASVLPSPAEWEATMAVAKQIAATPFVPVAYRGQPEAVVAAILTGREIGIGPMAALRQIHIIDGKAAFSAELMLSQMRKGGLVILDSVSTKERAEIHARRKDTGEEATVAWTWDEASQIIQKTKRLTEKDNWKNYPADMLWARTVGRLARRLGSDLLNGMVYASEELQDFDAGGYGGSGYDTEMRDAPAPAPATGGVELVAGAPKNPAEIAEALKSIDPDHPWGAWFDEACLAWFKKQRSDLDERETKELWVRWANGVEALRLACFAKGDFPPPVRAEVRQAFASPSSFEGLVLVGAHVPMDEAEYAETVNGVYTPKEVEEAQPPAEEVATQEEGVQPTDAALSPEAQEQAAAAPGADVEFGEGKQA